MQTPFTTIQTPFTSTTINEDFQDEDSIFPPVPSTGVGKERRQNFGNQPGKYGSPSFSDNKGENKTSKASNIPRTGTTESHQQHTSKKDGSEDDANGNNANSVSRGNWWQSSLYY
ncbi:hypothetical protein ACFX12_019436 [Malus domestica]